MTTRILCYGLGPIGMGIARLVAQRTNLRIVGAVDIAPIRVGRDLGELIDGTPNGVIITDTLSAALAEKPDIALHATGSALPQVAAQLEALAEAGVSVISTCEELAYPWALQPDIAAQLDRIARTKEVTLLGTGINPGYAMDALPLLLTAPCATVRSIRVTRVVDAALRRGPLQQKVGAGLSLDEFAQYVQSGKVRHVGLHESLHLLASALGWQLEEIAYSIAPVVADHSIETQYVQVQPGNAAGVRQVISGKRNGQEVLSLELQMYVGAPDPRDEVIIDGDPPIHMRIAGGIHGDVATAAIVVNAIPTVLRAAAGLATMMDVGVVHWRDENNA